MIIVFAGIKGGSGKSALARHLAVEWMFRGKRTVILDADPQGTTLSWANVARSKSQLAPPVLAVGDDVGERARELSQRADIVLIDTAGRMDERLGHALLVADLAILPVTPAPEDLWVLSESVEAVQKVQRGRPNLLARIAITKKARTVLAKQIRKTIERAEMPVLATELFAYNDYQEAVAVGKGVTTHAARSKAADELRALTTELERLEHLEHNLEAVSHVQ